MRRVILETPFAAPTWWGRLRNKRFARACLRDCLRLGEAPMASHLLYTQVLDDRVAVDRTLGIEAGLAWGAVADASVVYCDRGISMGMRLGIERALQDHRLIEFRRLDLEPVILDDEMYAMFVRYGHAV